MPRPKKATPETLAERQRRNRESYHRCKNNIKALNAEVDAIYNPDPKHLCPKCGKQMTRNKYACGTCLDWAERHYDVDAMCKWGSGLAIHRRGMRTVWRVG